MSFSLRILLILICTSNFVLKSQTETCGSQTVIRNTVGRDFAFVFLDNQPTNPQNPALEVYITSYSNIEIDVEVSSPWLPQFKTDRAHFQPYQSLVVYLDRLLELTGTSKSQKGIKVNATGSVQVVAMNIDGKNGESTGSFLAYPNDFMGSEYWVLTYCQDGANCQIGITTAVNNTQISIKLPTIENLDITIDGIKYGSGAVVPVTLYAYESIMIESSFDLTGTYIISTNPIFIVVGAGYTRISNAQVEEKLGKTLNSRSHIASSLPPLNLWGHEFIIPYYKERTNKNDRFLVRIITSVKGTYFKASEYINITLQDPGSKTDLLVIPENWNYLKANNPVMVVLFSLSIENDDSWADGDAQMLVIPPKKTWLNYYRFMPLESFAFNTWKFGYAVVVLESKYGKNLVMNENLVNNLWEWSKLPGSDYDVAIFNNYIKNGYTNTLYEKSGANFSLIVYGYAVGNSWGYPGGYQTEATVCRVTTGSPCDGCDNDCDNKIDEELCSNWADDDGDGRFDEDCCNNRAQQTQEGLSPGAIAGIIAAASAVTIGVVLAIVFTRSIE